MGWERIQSAVAGFLTHPLVLLPLSLLVFLVVVWAALPFALYGVRGRLDRILEALERIGAALEGGAPALPPEAAFAELRRALSGLGPVLRERAAGPSEVVFLHEKEGGEEVACLTLSRTGEGARLTFPLAALEEAFPAFSAGRFQEEVAARLAGRYGCFAEADPRGRELRVSVAPREGRSLDVLVEIVREQLFRPIRGEGR